MMIKSHQCVNRPQLGWQVQPIANSSHHSRASDFIFIEAEIMKSAYVDSLHVGLRHRHADSRQGHFDSAENLTSTA